MIPPFLPMDVEAPEVREAPPAPPPSTDVFARAGAGIGRGELFLGSPNGRDASRIPLSFEVGKMIADEIGMTGCVLVEPGRTDHGVAMTRIALGASFELHVGPLFIGLGPHATWFGATRKSHGPAGGGFEEAEDVLWRLGLGGHAMIGLDVHATDHAGVFLAVRADADALVSLGSPTVPFGTVSAIGGLSFY